MEIKEIETYDELFDYLLEKEEFADDRKSNSNPTFTKKEMWDLQIGICIKRSGDKISRLAKEALLQFIKKDFP